MPTPQQRRVVLSNKKPWYLSATNALAQSLVAYWRLDEASGTRADAVGSNTLTDNNTVTSNPGLVYPTAAQFTAANSESLSIADNAALSMGNIDFWFAAWVRLDTKTVDRPILMKGTDTAANANYEYALRFQQSNDRFRLSISDGTNAIGVSPTLGSIALNSWYFLLCTYDSTNDLAKISANGGTYATAAYTTGSFNSATSFVLGNIASTYMDGRMGPVMVGKNYVPSAADVTFLYNSGAGR